MPTKPNMRRRNTNVATSVGEDVAQGPVSSRQAHAEPARPNPYPHRLSVDVDHETYRALRLVAAEEGCRLVDLVRVAIAHELSSRL
jgi:hypothetical protein